MSLLILGATGTLGRQIVRQALNEGFQVKCLVRNFRKAAFLKEWGAELIYGDLMLPETLPLALIGITAIIDSSTTRQNDLFNVKQIDLYAKYILIQAAIKANIKRYIFFSILNCYKYKEIPLMYLKLMIEKKLKNTSINYSIFSTAGFFQGIIPQYALPVLDQQTIWITGKPTSIAYINTQDVANMVIKSLSIKQFSYSAYPLLGNKSWISSDIINLCEKISGQRAKINNIPLFFIKIIQRITSFFQWSWNISERLSLIEVLSRGDDFVDSLDKIYGLLQIQKIDSLDLYLQEYYEKIMKKLKDLNYQQKLNDNSINEKDF